MQKIVDIEIYVSNPGRNFVTVKVLTEDGQYGLGDATLNGREMAVVACLQEHIIPCLINRDAHNIEDIWQYLYKGVYWRQGPINLAAMGAIDMALWDLKGKIAQLPVYQLLGGKSRDYVQLYAHANGTTIQDTIAQAKGLMEDGFSAIRLQAAVPNLPVTYGVLGDKKDYFELQGNRPLPPEETWSTPKYFAMVIELFKTAREQLGSEVQLLHDVHSRLTPIETAKLAQRLEPYDLLFLEDGCMAENQENMKLVRQHSVTPLAIGETYNTLWECKDMIQNQWVDYIRCAATHAGGITGLRKIAEFASVFNVRMAPHGAPDLSPVCFAAHMHFNTWVPNFGIQEFVGLGNTQTQQLFQHQHVVKEGKAFVSQQPGLGIELDTDLAQKLPYKRSYLPVSRLEDGTLWNW